MLTIDLFAGGGGASEGITQATGHPVTLAINHDPHAVQMHALNHPDTHHRCESIYAVDPQHAVSDPLPAIVTKARHGLVTVEISGTTYTLTDIRLRMLTPRELARAQGFPDTYHLIGTQAQQIARIGNSVCPPVACALVAANLPPVQEARA